MIEDSVPLPIYTMIKILYILTSMYPWRLMLDASKVIFEYKGLSVVFGYNLADSLSVAHWFHYPDFKSYFGPSNLAHIFRFRKMILGKIEESQQQLVISVESNDLQRCNTLYLLAAFQLVEMKRSTKDIMKSLIPFHKDIPRFKTENLDASEKQGITIRSCLHGLSKAIKLGWLDPFFNDPNYINEYEWMEDPANGDMSWIIPKMLIAMAGPLREDHPKSFAGAPDISQVFQYLKDKCKVGLIIRLSRKHYEQKDLPKGLQVVDIFFKDGSTPNFHQIRKFQFLVKQSWKKGEAVAVHCRAGLGRTGTMIGTCLIDWLGFNGKEAVAYLRQGRPASVLGDQLVFLVEYSNRDKYCSEHSRVKSDLSIGKHGKKTQIKTSLINGTNNESRVI